MKEFTIDALSLEAKNELSDAISEVDGVSVTTVDTHSVAISCDETGLDNVSSVLERQSSMYRDDRNTRMREAATEAQRAIRTEYYNA